MRFCSVALFCAGLLSIGAGATPAIPDEASPAAASPELEAYIDGVMATGLANGDVVGATVAVVKDGRPLILKGYGTAVRDSRTPVDSGTVFRIGSVSKVFVWIAVLQQWQAGRLSLDADVNEYLEEFKIPGTFPEPVTLTHLMTHTPGFEDKLIGLFSHRAGSATDFHRQLVTMLPKRMWPPGELAAYSNYGTALAAYIVERVAGTAWDDYVDANILGPLGMTSTTTRQPLPDVLAARGAHGYRDVQARYESVPFEFVTLPPAGSVSATGPDMARLLLAFLGDGDGPVVTNRIRAKLLERAFAHDPRLNGMSFGMYEMSARGQRIVGHFGDTEAFHAAFVLYPEHELGMFVAFNSDRGAAARDELVRVLEDRWFGSPAPVKPAGSAPDLRPYAGWYRPLRVPESTPAKLLSLLGALQVAVDADGLLVVPSPEGPRRFYAVDRDLFQAVDAPERIAFGGSAGVKSLLFVDRAPFLTFERATWLRSPTVNVVLLAAVFLLFLIAFWKWPVSTIRRLNTRVPLPGEKRATSIAVLQMAGCVVFAVAVTRMASGSNEVLYGLPAWFESARWLPVGIAVLLLVQARYAMLAWTEGFWWLARRVHYTLTWVAGVAFVAWCVYWNVVPPQFCV